MKEIYPVIHTQSYVQALANCNIAFDSGADGVFLINHSIGHEYLLDIHSRLIKVFPAEFKIGINCLDLTPYELVFKLNNSIPMVWVDNALIDPNVAEQQEAQAVKEFLSRCNWNGRYFGGVAFKYQKPVKNDEELIQVTKLAANYVDVVTTSGPATGVAAPIEKIKLMKGVLGNKSLAIASGISAENVLDYLNFVDIFLVSSSISRDFYNLDPEKLNDLVDQILIT